jgi:hypothetical protein
VNRCAWPGLLSGHDGESRGERRADKLCFPSVAGIRLILSFCYALQRTCTRRASIGARKETLSFGSDYRHEARRLVAHLYAEDGLAHA